MGMKIRKKWDLPSDQRGALAVLAISFFLGGLAGSLLAALSGEAGALDLSGYLTDYLALAQENCSGAS